MFNTSSLKFPFLHLRKRLSGSKHTVNAGMTDVSKASATPGQVFIVGAGPGSAELLTIKAWKCLQQADIVLFDWLVDESVLKEIPRHVKTEFVGKRSGQHSMLQADICTRMVALASAGLNVVRLKGGDPAVFARTTEETTALQDAGIPFAIVPGITAASGASAYTGIPLTERDCAQSVTLTTAHFKDAETMPEWQALAETMQKQTVVVYMGFSRLALMADALQAAGVPADFPVAVIENACCPNQQVVTATISDIYGKVSAARMQGPALLIFGEVVKSRQQVSLSLLHQVAHVSGV